MKYAITFCLLGTALLSLLASFQQPWQIVLVVNVALCFIVMGFGFGWMGPGIFFKRPDGRLGWLSYLLFWPYHLLNLLGLSLVRLQPGRRIYDKIVPGLFLGRKLLLFDKTAFQRLKIAATLDLTCEFAESAFVKSSSAYKCIPLLDTFAPTLEQLDEGVAWMIEQSHSGPLYIHCAMGHGRSATYVVAYLIATGQVANIDEAMKILRAKRPGVDIKPLQFQALERWMQQGQSYSALSVGKGLRS